MQRLQPVLHDGRHAYEDHQRRREHPDRVSGGHGQGRTGVPRPARPGRAVPRLRYHAHAVDARRAAAPGVPGVGRIACARGWLERDQHLHRGRDLVAGAGQRADARIRRRPRVGEQRLQHLQRAGEALRCRRHRAGPLRLDAPGVRRPRGVHPGTAVSATRSPWRRPTRSPATASPSSETAAPSPPRSSASGLTSGS